MTNHERLQDFPQAEIEDAAHQAITHPVPETVWKQLGRCCDGDEAYRGLYEALAMRVHRDWGESVLRVLPPDHAARYWFTVLPDDLDACTVKAYIHQVVTRAYDREASKWHSTNTTTRGNAS